MILTNLSFLSSLIDLGMMFLHFRAAITLLASWFSLAAQPTTIASYCSIDAVLIAAAASDELEDRR